MRRSRLRRWRQRRQRKQKRNVAKSVAILAAILSAASFICEHTFKDALANYRDLLSNAAKEFRSQSDRVDLQVQIASEQQRLQLLKAQQATGDPRQRDYSAEIAADTDTARRAFSDFKNFFDSASKLTDALPTKAMLQMRDTLKHTSDLLLNYQGLLSVQTTDHSLGRFLTVKVALIGAWMGELNVLIDGDWATQQVEVAQKVTERLVRFFSWIANLLTLAALIAGIYLAMTMRSEKTA